MCEKEGGAKTRESRCPPGRSLSADCSGKARQRGVPARAEKGRLHLVTIHKEKYYSRLFLAVTHYPASFFAIFTMDPTQPAIALIGPTGVGKTALSLGIAERFGAEIVSVDSMQVYRYMDIGTAKASEEERARVPHHLLDVVTPDEEYSVARYIADATRAMAAVRARGRLPLLVGGTGLYLRGLEEGLFALSEEEGAVAAVRSRLLARLTREGAAPLHEELCRCDPDSAARIHPNDRHRLLRALEIFAVTGRPWSEHLAKARQEAVLRNVLKLGLGRAREELYQRINLRVGQMVAQGLLDEVRGLLAMGYGPDLKPMQAIGYRHMVEFLAGNRDWQGSIDLLARDTRRYAKRQFTWFRRDPAIHWHAPDREEEIFAMIHRYLSASAGGVGQ